MPGEGLLRPAFLCAVGAVALLSIACDDPPDRTSITTIGELETSSDGTEASVRLTKGTSVGDLIDLRVFGPFDPRVRPTADCPFGEPAEAVTRGGEHLCIYDRDGRKVAVVAANEPKSWGEGSIRRYELRALPPDPPYLRTLPATVNEIIQREPRLRTLVLVPAPPGDLGIRLDLEAGRVRGVTAAPMAWEATRPTSTDAR